MRIDGITIDGVKYTVKELEGCDCSECAFFDIEITGCPLLDGLELEECPLECGQVFKKEEA